MALAAVAADVAQARDVLLHLAAQLPLDHVLIVDQVRDPADLVLTELAGPDRGIDLELPANLAGAVRADAVDARQGHIDPLLVGNIHTCDTWHVSGLRR
jgi:hypothetical protein